MKRNTIIIVLLIVVLVVGGLWVSSFFYGAPSDPNGIWPEEGEVIATIDGVEYRYDPVYLYRLTGGYFADDPGKLATEDHVFHINTINFSPILSEKSLGENVVLLELLYKEAEVIFSEEISERTKPSILSEEGEFRNNYRTDMDDPQKEELLSQRYKEALFTPWQSYLGFVNVVFPYENKYHFIMRTVERYSLLTEAERMSYEDLLTKYNVVFK